ncbi:MAG: LptF/LptG family permease [Elusimicrobia bacterium]|nr:LptF/LptG family permease [Elusimicrobiota bacterium]
MRVPVSQLYTLKNFSYFFLLSVFVFAFLMMMINLLQIVNEGILRGFSFYFLSKSLVYLLPSILSMSLPVSFLMAILLSLGQMSGEGEIMALRAGGFSFREILSPILVFAAFLILFLFALNNWYGPKYLKRSSDYVQVMASRVTRFEITPKTFHRISAWEVYADRVQKRAGLLKDVKLFRRVTKKDSPAWIFRISADEGSYHVIKDKGILLKLKNGQFSRADVSNRDELMYGRFSSYTTLIPFFSSNDTERKIHPREMSTLKLFRELSGKELSAESSARCKIEITSRFSLMLTPAMFFLIGAPLGLIFEKKSKGMGFSISLLIIFAYYGLTMFSMVLAKKTSFFMPGIIFAPLLAGTIAGVFIWRRRLGDKE